MVGNALSISHQFPDVIMQTNVIRSLRTQCCTSHTWLQILQQSSQQWTTLTKSSQHIHTTRNFFHLYTLASPSLRRLSTVTTHAWTSQKCIVSLWVSHLFIFQPFANIDYSSSPKAQIDLLQDCLLGRWVDNHCWMAHQGRVHQLIHEHWSH